MCALTPFVALKGFRPADEIARALEPIARPELAAGIGRLAREQTPAALRALFARLMTLEPEEREPLLEARRGAGGAPHGRTRLALGEAAARARTRATWARSRRSTSTS